MSWTGLAAAASGASAAATGEDDCQSAYWNQMRKMERGPSAPTCKEA